MIESKVTLRGGRGSSKKPIEVLIIEDNINIRNQLTIALKELGVAMNDCVDDMNGFNDSLWNVQIGAVSVPDFVIHNLERLELQKTTVQNYHHQHGWYRKFEKPNKRRDLRR